jgi:hypothetical protein
MPKIVLDPISSGYNAVVKLNENFSRIAAALNNQVLYRNNPTGEPNALQSDVDVNGKTLFNVGEISLVGGGGLVQAVEEAEASAAAALVSENNAASSASAALSSQLAAAASVVEVENTKLVWRGDWSAVTSYAVNDAVQNNGTSYICILANTNEEPPNASYWNILAERGDDGAAGSGSGDVTSNTNTSVDGEIVLFSGTNGKVIRRTSLNGLLKATSGVLGGAVGGTDYIRPSDLVASAISYDNTISGLAATTEQTAIDELADEKLDKVGGTVTGITSNGTITETPVVANTGTDYIPDLASGTLFHLTLTGNWAPASFPTATAGRQFTIRLLQDGTGGRTVTFPAAVRRGTNATAYSLTGTANRADYLTFIADSGVWVMFVGETNINLS